MTALHKLAPTQQLTVEEFLAFTATRPDEERWELIEGVAVLNASPIDYHQIVVANIITFLMVHKQATDAKWLAMPGIGTRVPAAVNSLPQPDVLVKEQPLTGAPVTDDALVIFEVLSRSNASKDKAWRKRVYSSVPNCQHYVTISLKAVEVASFDKSGNWTEQQIKDIGGSLRLDALGVSLPLSAVYRFTPLASGTLPPKRKR